MAHPPIALTRNDLFKDLPASALERLVVEVTPRSLSSGEELFRRGESADRLYLVDSGALKLARYALSGREAIISVARAGDSLLEYEVVSGGTFPLTAVAIEECRVSGLPAGPLRELYEQDPAFCRSVAVRLAARVQQLTDRVDDLVLRDVTQRVARYLITEVGLCGRGAGGQARVVLQERNMVIAGILGTVPELVSRALARLHRSGVIRLYGRQVTIPSIEELRAVAAGEK